MILARGRLLWSGLAGLLLVSVCRCDDAKISIPGHQMNMSGLTEANRLFVFHQMSPFEQVNASVGS